MNVEESPEYALFVASRAKKGDDIVGNMSTHKAELLHMAVGIAGEAGELLDAVKKCVIYGRALDVENIREELGDLEFYMQGVRTNLGLCRRDIIEANVAKLSKRYEKGYSDEEAALRRDKAS